MTNLPPTWRLARSGDDDAIVRMCQALNAEDPGPEPVPAEQTRRTLQALRDVPGRGCAIVLDLDGQIPGYSLLISFWSNELGGEICVIDELYIVPGARGQGHATRLLERLAAGAVPWPSQPVALALEVTPNNARARRLYERAGFRAHGTSLIRRL